MSRKNGMRIGRAIGGKEKSGICQRKRTAIVGNQVTTGGGGFTVPNPYKNLRVHNGKQAESPSISYQAGNWGHESGSLNIP